MNQNPMTTFAARFLPFALLSVLACNGCATDPAQSRQNQPTFMVGASSVAEIKPRGYYPQKELAAASQICHDKNKVMVLMNQDDPAVQKSAVMEEGVTFTCTDAVVQLPPVIRQN